MKRMGLVLLASLLFLSSCAPANGDFRVLPAGQSISYRVAVTQSRVASGLGPRKAFTSSVTLDIDEQVVTKRSYALVVRAVRSKGEGTQRTAAQRMIGRRIVVDLDRPAPVGDPASFSGASDAAAADIAMLFVLLEPTLPGSRVKPGASWRRTSDPAALSWSATRPVFTVSHSVSDLGTLRDLEAAEVSSSALGNVDFRLPLVVQNPKATSKSNELIVNQLFDALFSDVHNPVQGITAAIASIPLAILAPFISLGQAIGNLFGSKNSSKPSVPDVDLAGPLSLKSTTDVWTHDGRVLAAKGTGTMALVGQLPRLPGRAASLSGKALHLDTTWTIGETMLSPFPPPPPTHNVALELAALIAVLGAAGLAVAYRMRRVMRPR